MNFLKPMSALLALSLTLGFAPTALAQSDPSVGACSLESPVYTADQIHIIGVKPNAEVVKELLSSFNDLVSASNRHSINDILKHYDPKFISGDNLSLDQIKSLILETWKTYSNICYSSKPIEMRVDGDWATIETLDHSYATAPPEKDVISVPGKMVSDSRSLLFYRRLGNTWEITSDATVWEQAVIRYGLSDDLEVTLSAPEQVKAGQPYSATIEAKLPEGTFTIANIDNEPLTFPHPKTQDVFRALTGESNNLQRVLTANTDNRNEIVTATLGITNIEQKNSERPSLSLNGIITIVKRVNTVPISGEDMLKAMHRHDIVKTSASGKVDLRKKPEAQPDAATPELEIAPAPSNSAPGHTPEDDEDK